MTDDTADELREAQRALTSMLSKSQKALAKLAEGTWQHRLTASHVAGLTTALAVLAGEAPADGLEQAREALADSLRRIEKAKPSLAEGSPQMTLAVRRIAALRIASALITQRLASLA